MEIVGIIVIVAFFGFLIWQLRKDSGPEGGDGPGRDDDNTTER